MEPLKTPFFKRIKKIRISKKLQNNHVFKTPFFKRIKKIRISKNNYKTTMFSKHLAAGDALGRLGGTHDCRGRRAPGSGPAEGGPLLWAITITLV